MDKIFKALADINRRRIISLLREREMSVNEIVNCLDIGQATVSSHLLVLKKAGLVNLRIETKKHFYNINWEILGKFIKKLNKFNRFELDELILRRKGY